MAGDGGPALDAGYWDGIAAQEDALPDGWRHHARREHLALLERWVGTPTGRWLKTDLFEERTPARALLPSLRHAWWLGADIAPEVARQARAAVGCVTTVMDVRALPFAPATFDGVLSTSTLDHFDDPADIGRSLVELRRILRPGAPLVLTLDNPRNPLVRLRNALPPAVARRTGLVPFSVGATMDDGAGASALDAAGFDVVDVTHVLHAPHVVGTRLARYAWYAERVLPRTTAIGRTRLAPWSGHFVAFHAVAR